MENNIVIIGAGKVGSSLGAALAEAGYKIIAVINKPYDLAVALGDKVNAQVVSENFNDIPRKEKIIILSVEDSEIEPAAVSLAQLDTITPEDTIVHTSGALSADALEKLKEKGCKTGSFHPMQTFPGIEYSSDRIKGIFFAIEGNDRVSKILTKFARDMNCETVNLRPEYKTPYHLGGVFTSNFLICLLYIVEQIYEKCGILKKDALKILKPIIYSTLENVDEKGTVNALTGPVVRGDAGSVERHLDYLKKNFPEYEELYRGIGKICLEIAGQRENLPQGIIEHFEETLKGSK